MLRDQCQASEVPVYVKQLGRLPIGLDYTPHRRNGTYGGVYKHPKGGDPAEWPEDVQVREFPRVAKGVTA
jgi:hypothetical protein